MKKSIFLLLLPVFSLGQIHYDGDTFYAAGLKVGGTLVAHTYISAPRLLTWEDFKGKPNPHHTAMSALSIGWYQSTWEDGVHVRFDSAVVEFNEYGSYTNTDDPYILNHEQQHLNILFLQVRNINKWIHIHHIKYTQEQYEAMQLELTRRWHKADDLYDEETNNSINREGQAKWDLWIATQLKHNN